MEKYYVEVKAYPTIGILLLGGVSDNKKRLPRHTTAGIADDEDPWSWDGIKNVFTYFIAKSNITVPDIPVKSMRDLIKGVAEMKGNTDVIFIRGGSKYRTTIKNKIFMHPVFLYVF